MEREEKRRGFGRKVRVAEAVTVEGGRAGCPASVRSQRALALMCCCSEKSLGAMTGTGAGGGRATRTDSRCSPAENIEADGKRQRRERKREWEQRLRRFFWVSDTDGGGRVRSTDG